MEHNFNYDEMFKIAAESNLETASKQELKRSTKFFRPRLRSVNHLHDSGSNLLSHPLALIAEEAFLLYEKVRDSLGGIMRRLFPRNPEVVGEIEDSHLVGRITFSTRQDQFIPIHHLHLEVWARTRMGQWRKITEGSTNEDGYFRLGFEMKAVHSYNLRPKLRFEIYHSGGHVFNNNKAKPVFELFKSFKFAKKDLTGLEFNMGLIQLFYWEYMKDSILPRVVIKDHDKDAPQKYPKGRTDAISEQFIPIELTTKRHILEIKRGKDMSLEDIQEDYPINLTYSMEKHKKGITRSDEWFAERMMNGMPASTFDKDPEDPSQFWVYHHWRSYAHDDSEYALHNVSMKFRLNEQGYLKPTEIQLRGPIKKGGDPNELHVLKPGDGIRWEGAKRVARVSSGLLTEIDSHFAGTHLNTEQYAIAAYRNIRRNPIGALLFPHIKEVVLINHTAFQILVNPEGYICRSTALKGEGLNQRVLDVMGTLDWKHWKPMQAISDKHRYALAAKIYWEMLVEYVDEFVAGHMAEIIEEWHELFTFSKDVFEHSVPAFLCKHLQKATGSNPAEGITHKSPKWYTTENRMDLQVQRDHFKGTHKAVSRIIENKTYNPESEDIKNLKQVCSYIIFHSTFGHFWANSKQYDDIGEVRYCSLGLRYGDGPDGVLGPETDDSISPDKIISTQMMWWSNMLSRTGYGFIMSNEDKDINPVLIEKLKAREKEFDELGVSIYDIQSRTNI